jgi:hypothetical protein
VSVGTVDRAGGRVPWMLIMHGVLGKVMVMLIIGRLPGQMRRSLWGEGRGGIV